MGSIAEVHVPAEEFTLHQTLVDAATARFEIERMVAHDADRVLPFVWATADDQDALKATMEADPSVESLTLLSDYDETWLYRMEWIDRVQLVTHILLEHEAAVLDAAGADDEWHLRILFPSRESLSQTYDFAQKQGLTMDVHTIYQVSRGGYDRYGLTEEQHETLLTAFDRGYYDIPHGVSTSELGEEFDITAQAVSKRLHRGHGNLVKEALVVGREPEPKPRT